MDAQGTGAATAPRELAFEFRGSGGEYFRIWIVNLALTLVTLGIYGPWAKVRTWRYFFGSTYVDGHAFEYHASALRILIGRMIALALFLGYSLTAQFRPSYVGIWALLFLFALPWLAVSSIRFTARNTSYRNVRLNFRGTYGEAFVAYVLWPLAGVFTLGALIPRARKARDYFYINNHTYGGRYFETEFSTWSIYAIYLIALGVLIAGLIAVGAATAVFVKSFAQVIVPARPGAMPPPLFIVLAMAFYLVFIFLAVFVETMVFNLSISHTKLDDRHELRSTLAPLTMLWLYISNLFLVVITIGIFYPWAVVRLARYHRDKLTFIARGDLDQYASEVIGTQSAVGEEIAGFFDLGFGL